MRAVRAALLKIGAVRIDLPHCDKRQQIVAGIARSEARFAENCRREAHYSSLRRFSATTVLTAPKASNHRPHCDVFQQRVAENGSREAVPSSLCQKLATPILTATETSNVTLGIVAVYPFLPASCTQIASPRIRKVVRKLVAELPWLQGDAPR